MISVLVAPLDWGLGHASRCIPVIREFAARGCTVIAAATDAPARLLRTECPDIEIVPITGYGISYARSVVGLYLKFPSMFARVAWCASREHRELERFVKARGVDIVVSDNRFGCHTQRAHCVYMTHQACILMPRGFGWFERILARAHRRVMAHFDQVWIPDIDGPENLTGALSSRYPRVSHSRFVGPLSRFTGQDSCAREEPLDLLVMISGPEPQRTLFEQKVRKELEGFGGRALVALGRPCATDERQVRDRVTYVSSLPGQRLHAAIATARAVVCRGGYSTIMELVSLGARRC